MTATDFTVINIAPKRRFAAPVGDRRDDASAVFNQVLSRSLAFTDELRAIANRHVEEAPASSEHLSELTAVLSRLLLDWIEDWPA